MDLAYVGLYYYLENAYFFSSVRFFFSVLLINKIGLKSYTLDRFIRIGLTCLFFSALFDILDGNFDLTLNHLWFLYYFVYIHCYWLSFLYLFRWFKTIISKKLTIRVWMVILLLLIMIGQLSILINGSLSPLLFYPPETYLDVNFGALVYYLPFYLVGIFYIQINNYFTYLILGDL